LIKIVLFATKQRTKTCFIFLSCVFNPLFVNSLKNIYKVHKIDRRILNAIRVAWSLEIFSRTFCFS